ncbi:MAG: patatin-like phospholipase family protein [Mycobacteriales bacterium]
MTVLSFLRRHRLEDEPGPHYRDAVVLSGGGSLGAVQVGALRSLFDAGVVPDLLVGCSVGALNAAFVAMEPTEERVEALDALWRRLDRNTVFPSCRRSVAGHLVRHDSYLYEPEGLRSLVRRWVPVSDLSDTAVPCHVVTTDLLAGAPVWWSAGDPARVLVASASLPGLLPPVEIDGTLHVDGGVTSPVPAQRAVDLGASRVWVLDVTGGSIGRRDNRMSALDVLLISFAISRHRLGTSELVTQPGQRIIRMPPVAVARQDLRDFSQTGALIELGAQAGRRMVLEGLGAAAS